MAAFWRLDPSLFGRHDGTGRPDASSEQARLLFPPPPPAGARWTLGILDQTPGIGPPRNLPDAPIGIWLADSPVSMPRGRILAHLARGAERRPAIVETDRGVVFAFDPEDAIEHVLQERYYVRRRPLYTRLPFNYHKLLPATLRSRIRSLYNRSARSATDSSAFPAWPVEPSIETLRDLVATAARLVAGTPTAPSWPQGKRFAVALTHDVDGRDGQHEVPAIAAIESARGFVSAWFLPTHRYPLDHGLLADLRERGHEIGCHDWNHDNRTSFLSEPAIRRRLEACRRELARHGSVGYRAPSLMRSPRLFAALGAEGYLYDTSVGDSERLLQCADASGCGTVFPFVRDRMLEIPCTQPLENILQYMGMEEEAMLDLWRTKLAWIRRVGGVAVYTTHADPHFSGNPTMRRVYERLLDELAADSTAWMTTPAAIAAHWRSRGHVPDMSDGSGNAAHPG